MYLSILTDFSEAALCYFDENNQPIAEVEEGTVILSVKAKEIADLEVGNVLEFRTEDLSLSLTIAGFCKDAVLGSDLMGNVRLLVNETDFEKCSSLPLVSFRKTQEKGSCSSTAALSLIYAMRFWYVISL